jgi:hypothetical protein
MEREEKNKSGEKESHSMGSLILLRLVKKIERRDRDRIVSITLL